MSDPSERIYESLLVIRAQTGDNLALAEIMERYSARLRYFLRKLLPTTEQVDDVLQDVWLDVIRSLPNLVEPKAMPAWIYRIARNHAYRRHRDMQRVELPLDETQILDATPDEEFLPADAARIHAGLDRLSPEQREVLVLKFLEELSYEEIASIVGCKLGTVRSRIHYAKLALRRELDP